MISVLNKRFSRNDKAVSLNYSALPQNLFVFSFFVALQPKPDLGRLIVDVSRSRTIWNTYTTVSRTPLKSDRPVADATTQYITHARYEHPCLQQHSNPRSQQTSGRRLRGHRYRPVVDDSHLETKLK